MKSRKEGDSHISIHAPREGSDLNWARCMDLLHKFQSTLPVRGATLKSILGPEVFEFQSTLPVRGATRQKCGDGSR